MFVLVDLKLILENVEVADESTYHVWLPNPYHNICIISKNRPNMMVLLAPNTRIKQPRTNWATMLRIPITAINIET